MTTDHPPTLWRSIAELYADLLANSEDGSRNALLTLRAREHDPIHATALGMLRERMRVQEVIANDEATARMGRNAA